MMRKFLGYFLIFAVFLFTVNLASATDWYTTSRASAGIAPDPLVTDEAIVHVYGADTWGWRGWFAIHTWVAAKRSGEPFYRIYDVVSWRGGYGNQSVVAIRQGVPDRYWFGAKPELLAERRGEGVDEIIDAIDKAAEEYPWKYEYKAFPGPNSNTFVAWIGKMVPELELDLPFSAIGSSYVNTY